MSESSPGHPTEAELKLRLAAVHPSPADRGRVVQIVVRPEVEARLLPESCEITPAEGVVGDRWARTCSRRLPGDALNPDTQLTLMNTRLLAVLVEDPTRWPEAGDNFLVDLDLSQANLPVGQRLSLGTAIVEITMEPHNGCAKFSRRFGPDALKFVNSPEGKQLRLRGVHAQVVQAGRVQRDDTIAKL